MLKLPFLQPQLTGPHGVEGKHAPESKSILRGSDFRLSARSDESSDTFPVSLEHKGWREQALEVTRDMPNAARYKSLSLHAEVKLTEALERCRQICPPTLTEEGDEKPSKLRTAVCCQLLGECAELCGPFNGVLRTIRDELVRSIYSSMYASERGTLAFEQLPHFLVAERLEREKGIMGAEREAFRQLLLEREKQMEGIEEQVGSLLRAVEGSEEEARRLQGVVAGMQVAAEAQQLEARTAREELKRVRKEALRATDQLDALRKAHHQLQEESAEREKKLTLRAEQLGARLHGALEELADARQLAAERLDPGEVAELRLRLGHAEMDAGTLRLHEQELEAQVQRMGAMTPRPAWGELQPFGPEEPVEESSTLDVVQRLVRQHRELGQSSALLRTHLQHARALLAPDPTPSPLRLVTIQDSSAYFITEGAGLEDEDKDEKPAVYMDGLGLSAAVPRWLRWKGRLQVQDAGVQALEASIRHFWQQHEEYRQRNAPQSLAGAVLLALHGREGSPQEAAQRAYSLLYACQCHQQASAVVRLFWKVLMGQLPEEAHYHSKAVGSTLAEAAAALAMEETQGASQEGVSKQLLLGLLSSFFPRRSPKALDALRDALSEQFPADPILLPTVVAAFSHQAAAAPAAAIAAAVPKGKKPAQGVDVQSLLVAQLLHEVEEVVDRACGGLQMAAHSAGLAAGMLPLPEARAQLAAAGAAEGVVGRVMEQLAVEQSMMGAGGDGEVVQLAHVVGLVRRRALLQPDTFDAKAGWDWCNSRSKTQRG